MAIVVEILARNNHVVQRYFVDKQQISIGRAYDNDIHVDDPYVCAHHVDLEEQEQHIKIQDNQSVNGLKINNKANESGVLSHADVVTLGRTRMRIFSATRDIAQTKTLSQLEEKLEWLSSTKVCIGLLCLLALSMGLTQYLHTFTEVKVSQILESVTKVILFICLWPLSFSFISKLNKKDGRVTSQLSLLFIVMLGYEAIGYLETFLLVNTGAIMSVDIASKGIELVLFFLLLWFSLFIGFHQANAKRNKIAGLFTLLAFVALILPKYLNINEFNPRPAYNSTVLPPVLMLGDTISAEEFVAQAEHVFADAKQAAAKD